MNPGGEPIDQMHPGAMQSFNSARRNNPLRWRVRPSPQKATRRIAEDLRIYAVGDIHGRSDLLQKILDAIDMTLVTHPVENVVQVFLGDYIDRGPDSRRGHRNVAGASTSPCDDLPQGQS
jgi:hypothetical protein